MRSMRPCRSPESRLDEKERMSQALQLGPTLCIACALSLGPSGQEEVPVVLATVITWIEPDLLTNMRNGLLEHSG
jgi:hypothetical protein